MGQWVYPVIETQDKTGKSELKEEWWAQVDREKGDNTRTLRERAKEVRCLTCFTQMAYISLEP